MKVYHRWDWMLALFPNFSPSLAFFTCFRGGVILQCHPQDVRGACFLKAWHHHPWRRPVMAESPGRAPIFSLCYGRPSCYLTWLRPKTTSICMRSTCVLAILIFIICVFYCRECSQDSAYWLLVLHPNICSCDRNACHYKNASFHR